MAITGPLQIYVLNQDEYESLRSKADAFDDQKRIAGEWEALAALRLERLGETEDELVAAIKALEGAGVVIDDVFDLAHGFMAQRDQRPREATVSLGGVLQGEPFAIATDYEIKVEFLGREIRIDLE